MDVDLDARKARLGVVDERNVFHEAATVLLIAGGAQMPGGGEGNHKYNKLRFKKF